MFRRKEKPNGDPAIPERAGYTKYYEHDGLLRAYANRSMLMAGLFGVIALVSLGFAIYVRLQPATVIRSSARRYSVHGDHRDPRARTRA